MSLGATIFGEYGGCISSNMDVNIAKSYGHTVLGESCGIAPPLPEAMATDSEFLGEEAQMSLYTEAYETLEALLVLAKKQRWPSDIPIVERLQAGMERAQEAARTRAWLHRALASVDFFSQAEPEEQTGSFAPISRELFEAKEQP